MNKLFTKIAALCLGATMAVGVGVAVASTSKVGSVSAAVNTRLTLDTTSTTIATSNSYGSYGEASTSYQWAVTCGSKQSSGLWLGSNSKQSSKMTLGNGSYSDASDIATAISVQTTSTYYAAIIQRASTIANVDTVTLTYSGTGGSAPTEAWILYSTSGTTWQVFEKVTSLSASGTDFTHDQIASARYAFVIHSTNYCQFKDPKLVFKGTDATTQTISGFTSGTAGTGVALTTNATSSTSWSITANSCGATLSASTGTSITVNATGAGSVTIQATCSGYTPATHTITFASAAAETITVTGTNSMYVGDASISLTATPSNFTPASYTWLSSNTGVATVSGTGTTGTVSAVAKGTTNITASATGTNGTVVSNSFTITVKQFSIALSTSSVSMKASKSTTVTVTPTDANGTVVVTATSNNTSAATTSVSGTTITITSGSEGGVSTTITVSAKDNNGASGYHSAVNQTISVEVTAGYVVGSKITALPASDTKVFLANVDKSSWVGGSGTSLPQTSNDGEAALFVLSSTGTLRYYNQDTDQTGNYVYCSGSNTTVSMSASNAAWSNGMNNATYPGLLQLSGGRFLMFNSNIVKAYAASNLDANVNNIIYAYEATASTPTVSLSGNSVSGLKGDSDTSLTLSISNFTATGLNVTYEDDGESSFSASSDVATVTCGHTTGNNTVSVSFDGVGSTTVKLSVTRGSGDPIDKTFTVTVAAKPAVGTLVAKLNSIVVSSAVECITDSYVAFTFEAEDTDGNAYAVAAADLKLTITSGSSYGSARGTTGINGTAEGTVVARFALKVLEKVYVDVTVNVVDDYIETVGTPTFAPGLTDTQGQSPDVSVFTSRPGTMYSGSSTTIPFENYKFSYTNNYASAEFGSVFTYDFSHGTTVDSTHKSQTIYVFCDIDEAAHGSFTVTVEQFNDPLTAITFTNVTNNEVDVVRGNTFQLEWSYTPTNPTDGKGVEFIISDNSDGIDITVSEFGLISIGASSDLGDALVIIQSTHDDSIQDYVVVSAVLGTMKYTVSETESWTEVTNDSTLNVGDVIVIANYSAGAVAGSISSQILSGVTSDVTFSTSSTITELPDTALQLTLGGQEGAWTLSNSDGQKLGATAVKKLAWDSGTTTWDISISDSGATIQNGTSSYGRFLYNKDSPRFTTYTSATSSSMLLPQIYLKSGGDVKMDVTEALFNGVHNNFGTGKTYEWSESCSSFDNEMWLLAGGEITGLTDYEDYKLNIAVANESGNEIEQFLAKYDFIVAKFKNADYDFLGRFTTGGINDGSLRANVNPISLISNNSSQTVAIIVVISMIGVVSIGGYFFLRKRKEY